jgi:predicted nucleic acid-binding protein
VIRLGDGAVLDASVVVKLLVPEPGTDMADRLFDELTSTPRWLVECANALWLKVRRRTMTERQGEGRLLALRRLAAAIDLLPVTSLVLPGWRLATTLGITVHDACYVALAETQGVPLVTADAQLVRRCGSLPQRVLAPCAQRPRVRVVGNTGTAPGHRARVLSSHRHNPNPKPSDTVITRFLTPAQRLIGPVKPR